MAKRRASSKMSDGKKEQCRAMLIEGKFTKREIANILRIDSGYVYRMYDEENIGHIRAELAEKEKEKLNKEQELPKSVKLKKQFDKETPTEIKEAMIMVEEETKEKTEGKKEVDNVISTREKLTQEDKINIALACEKGDMLRKDIAAQYNVSPATVSVIAKDMGVPPAQHYGFKKVNTTSSEKSTISPVDTTYIVEIFKGSHVTCGLIAERHDIPCTDFIFEEALPSNMMHQYDYQYNKCMEFIKEHITFSKSNYKLNSEDTIVASADIICYMTGCQSVLGALVKACFESRVNLTLMHYDTDIRDYHSQVIFSHFRDENNLHEISYLEEFLNQYNKAYFYKCTESDIKGSDGFYIVNRVNIGTNTTYDKYTKKGAVQNVYVCKNDGDAWELYPKLAKEIIQDKSENICLYMIPIEQSENEWKYGTAFAKTYNFKSEGTGNKRW